MANKQAPVKKVEHVENIDKQLQRRYDNDAQKKAVPPHRLSQFGKDRRR